MRDLCAHHIGRGRAVLSNCQKKPGFGPKGQYCQQHAPLYETKPALVPLWEVSTWGSEIQKRFVREANDSSFVDSQGHRRGYCSRFGRFFKSEEEAITFVRERLVTSVESCADALTEAKRELREFQDKHS